MSGETQWLVQNELASLEHSYASGEILGVPAHCLIGTEIDFDVYMDNPTPEQQAALETSREAVLSELSLLGPKDEEQAQRKAEWLQQVPHLTPAELINYHIYRRLSVPTLDPPVPAMYLQADDSPETTLEFVFGNGLYQTGYYDNPGFFEMRTQAAKPTIAMERVRRAIAIGSEVARSFGACFSYKGDQTNFSVWVPGNHGLQPLHSLDNPEGQEMAAKATAGILHALRDSMVVLQPPSSVTLPHDELLQLEAGPERAATLRVVPERFEQRSEVGPENHALSALFLMSGFAHGVTDPTLDTRFVHQEPQNLLVSGPGYDKVRDLYLLRALQRSELDGGHFVFGGVSALNVTRSEGMLSSIIGAEVYDNGNASHVISRLLGCISLTPNGTLEADEQAFERVLQQEIHRHRIYLQGTPTETISERLRRIRCIADSVTITGSVDYVWPSGVALHGDLEKFVAAPSLAHISTAVMETVRREREAFTHDEAVSGYCWKKIDDIAGPVAEKVARIQEAIHQFPDADTDKVAQLIRDELRKRANSFARAISAYEAKPNDDHDEVDAYTYSHWRQQRADDLALLQGLEEKGANRSKFQHIIAIARSMYRQ
jgi:hypothetical protein